MAVENDLLIQFRKSGEISVLGLSGDVDVYTCSILRDAIIHSIDQGDQRMVINMANVNYIDSSGLGTLVGGLRRVKQNDGHLAISSATPRIRKVLKITGLNKVFTIFEDEDSAVRSLDT